MMNPKEQEEMFQVAMSAWDTNHEAKYKDVIWERVFEACKANASKLMKGLKQHPDFIDRTIQATDTVIRYIFENGKRPRKLITFCYLPTLAAFQGPKAMQEDGVTKDKDDNISDRDVSLDYIANNENEGDNYLSHILYDDRYDSEKIVFDKEEKVISCIYKGKPVEFKIYNSPSKSVILLNEETIFVYDVQKKRVVYIDNPKMEDNYKYTCNIA